MATEVALVAAKAAIKTSRVAFDGHYSLRVVVVLDWRSITVVSWKLWIGSVDVTSSGNLMGSSENV